MRKLSDFYNSKNACNEEAQAAREHAKESSGEFLGVRKITRKVYNTLFKKCVEKLIKTLSK